MRTFVSIRAGLGRTRGLWAMVVFLFLVNLFFSLALAVPLFQDLKDSFGQSHVGKDMARGFDYLWWEQFRYESKGVAETFSPSMIGRGAILDNLEYLLQLRFFGFPPLLLSLLVLYLLFRTLLTGGIISQLKSRSQNFSLVSFLQGAGTYFFRFALLMFMSWVFFYLVGGPLRGKLTALIKSVSARSYSEIPEFSLGLLAAAVVLVLFLFIQMIFDYARILTVLGDAKNVIASFLKAVTFSFKNFGSTMGISCTLLFFNAILTVGYIGIIERIPQSAFGGILLAFLVQELFVSLVIFLRCWLYASQFHLYQSAHDRVTGAETGA